MICDRDTIEFRRRMARFELCLARRYRADQPKRAARALARFRMWRESMRGANTGALYENN